jgi:hypothetical protein
MQMPVIQYFVTRTGWGVTFECDLQNQEMLLQAFPWLRSIRDNFEQGHRLPIAALATGSQPCDDFSRFEPFAEVQQCELAHGTFR